MLIARKQVSVFDSSVQGGDAVGESLRVYNGSVFMLDRCDDGASFTEKRLHA